MAFNASRRHQNLSQVPSFLDVAFKNWAKFHGKSYGSPSELQHRKNVFIKNYFKIDKANKAQNLTYTSSLNKFADLSEREFISKYTGLKLPKDFKTTIPHHNDHISLAQASSIDWRTKGAVNPVKDQGQCGSCWAFSATSAFESVNFIKNNKLYNLSEQEAVDCDPKSHGCEGGWMDYAWDYVRSAGGWMETKDYPYTARDGSCKFKKSKVVAQVAGYKDITQNDCKTLQSQVFTQPISVAIAANAIMFYSSGVFNNRSCGTGLNHGVTLDGVGSDPSGGDFYLVRNSWGGNWGEDGYIRMSRNVQTRTGICGICMAASYPQAE